MRVSAYHDHPDFKPEWLGCHVILNGEAVKNVTHADEELGQVAVHVTGRHGQLLLDGPYTIATKILRGRVELRRDWKHVDAIGFDAWMRARTEAAHNEFMKRTV